MKVGRTSFFFTELLSQKASATGDVETKLAQELSTLPEV